MKLVKVKFLKKGQGFLYLGNDELNAWGRILPNQGRHLGGEVIDIPDVSILMKISAYIPLKECVGIDNDYIRALVGALEPAI